MIRLSILAFLVLAPFLISAQVIDKKIEAFVGELQVDTFMVYSFPCSGVVIPMDSCNLEETKYLFWQANNHYYVKKFDYCKAYKLIEIDSTSPLHYYLVHRRTIDQERIKPPTCYVFKRNKNKIDTLKGSSYVDHSCYHTFLFKTGKHAVRKQADIYDLDLEKFDDGRKNIFHAYNNGTKFKSLIDRVKACLKELERDNKYIMD